MPRALKYTLIGLAFVVSLSIGVGVITHQYRLHVIADHVDEAMLKTDRSAFAIGLARYVSFEHRGAQAPLEPWFGALSGRRLPEWIRLPVGLLEMMSLAASCDSQARALVYLLTYFGFEAHQFDAFGGGLAHSFAEVWIDGRWVILDPYTGVVVRNPDDQIVGFEEMQRLGYENLSIEAIRPDGPKFFDDTWKRFETAVGGKSGDPIWMPVHVDLSRMENMVGERDYAPINPREDVGIIGIAGRFFGAEFGSGKNSVWRFSNGAPGETVNLVFHFTNARPPPFPVDGAVCDWPEGLPILTCGLVIGSTGEAEVRFNFADLREVFHIDWIEVDETAAQ